MSQRAPRYQAFTLVELLVCVSIITVLVSLILVAGPKAMQIAKTTKCLNNLRSLHGGIMLYATDNEGRLPYDNSNINGGSQMWHRLISGYIGGPPFTTWNSSPPEMRGTYLCPADKTPFQGLISYGINGRLLGYRLSTITTNPLCLMDASNTQVQATGTQITGQKTPHNGNGCAILLDGSAFPFKTSLPAPTDDQKLWSPN